MSDFLFLLLTLPLLGVAGYFAMLILLSGKPGTPASDANTRRFLVLIPAHDEAQGIASTVGNLLALDWPPEQRRVQVIADNCSDDTASRARAAGAEVIERHDRSRRGKGFALEYAFELALKENWADAVLVIDADSIASPQILHACNARMAAGAPAVQVFYGVLNPDAGWRTRLIAVALAIFHRMRGRAREVLGVSCGLRGNGMCFTVDTLRAVPHQAFSIVEDVEYGIRLGRAGLRVWYADEVEVLGEMVSSEDSARSQRQRWEQGRAQMARRFGFPLLKQAVQKRSGLLLDLALDVLIPPLGTVGVAAAVAAMLGLLLWYTGFIATTTLALAISPAAVIALLVMRGVVLSGLGLRGWSALASAPAYVLWKLALKFRSGSRPGDEWVRTRREAETPDRSSKP